jgi:hypothetical protein
MTTRTRLSTTASNATPDQRGVQLKRRITSTRSENLMKHRLLAGGVCAVLVTIGGAPGAAHADASSPGCPSDKWSQSVFPLNWQPGDPMDPNGQNLLLQIGLAGTIQEFGSLQAGLSAFGFDNLEQFYTAVIDPDYNAKDRNDDGILCVKPYPVQGNQAAYLANAIDNNAKSS